MHGSVKQSTHTELLMKMLKCLEIWQILTQEQSFEQPIHFLVQPHTWNAWCQVLHWCNDVSCLKCMRKMIIQASKEYSSFAMNSTLYNLNVAFLHPHSYTKSAYFGSLYLHLHFCIFFMMHHTFETPCLELCYKGLLL